METPVDSQAEEVQKGRGERLELPQQAPLFTKAGLPLCKAFVWLILQILGPFRVSGSYRVPREGGVLILSNHQADIDPPALQVGCPRAVYFMAKSELFEMKLIGRVIRWFAPFPVRRGAPDRQAIKTAVGLLKRGEAVCVFPEGELSETGELLPLKEGVGLIVRMAGVPVICCGLKNTNRIMPYGKVIPRPAFRTVSVNWGEPRQFSKADEIEDIMAWVEGQLRELTS